MQASQLECKNPCHPPGASKKSMICVKEHPEYFVFACRMCMEVNRVQSIQVKTREWVKQETRKSLAARNLLLKAMPPKVRKFIMDESQRTKER